MNINIHIEQLLLDGIDITHGQLAVLKSSFEIQLAHLLAQEGIGPQLQQGAVVRTIQADPIGPARNNDPSRLGERIARSVHRGLR